ncbi:MAG: hypothetical protein Q8R28_08195 [Dehalococcoidia bacterium]|nr:hypothetical protein [Dehalococcoidia bacterium]
MEEEQEPVACHVCGSDVCCNPAHAETIPQRNLVCRVCGKKTIVESKAAPGLCCGEQMIPDVGEVW